MLKNALTITLFSFFIFTSSVSLAKDWSKASCPSDPKILAEEAFLLLTSGYQIGSDKCKGSSFKYFDTDGIDIRDSKSNLIVTRLIYLSASIVKKEGQRVWLTVKFKDGFLSKEMPIEIDLRLANDDGSFDDLPCGTVSGNFDPTYVNKECI